MYAPCQPTSWLLLIDFRFHGRLGKECSRVPVCHTQLVAGGQNSLYYSPSASSAIVQTLGAIFNSGLVCTVYLDFDVKGTGKQYVQAFLSSLFV